MLMIGVEAIRKLSQEEGLFDDEIAEQIGVHRTTVNRIRNQYSIPRANLKNRKDKEVHCTICRKEFIIRRREKVYICPKCQLGQS